MCRLCWAWDEKRKRGGGGQGEGNRESGRIMSDLAMVTDDVSSIEDFVLGVGFRVDCLKFGYVASSGSVSSWLVLDGEGRAPCLCKRVRGWRLDVRQSQQAGVSVGHY